MNAITVAICILGVFVATASAETSAEQDKSLKVVSDLRSQIVADEAVLVGHILRNVAYELRQNAELESETEEYFIRNFWNKTKEAVKKACRKIKKAAKKVMPHIQNAAKDIVKSVANAVIPIVNEKAEKKATELVTKFFAKHLDVYALQDSGSHTDVVRSLCTLLDEEGKRLIEHGEKLNAHQFVFSID
ncbi:uncharacterized protein LOC144123183 [Amblyomma americanum]